MEMVQASVLKDKVANAIKDREKAEYEKARKKALHEIDASVGFLKYECEVHHMTNELIQELINAGYTVTRRKAHDFSSPSAFPTWVISWG